MSKDLELLNLNLLYMPLAISLRRSLGCASQLLLFYQGNTLFESLHSDCTRDMFYYTDRFEKKSFIGTTACTADDLNERFLQPAGDSVLDDDLAGNRPGRPSSPP